MRILPWPARPATWASRPLSGVPNGTEFLKLGEDTYHLAVPDDHPLAKRDIVSLAELKNEPFIFHQAGQVAYELCLRACRRASRRKLAWRRDAVSPLVDAAVRFAKEWVDYA